MKMLIPVRHIKSIRTFLLLLGLLALWGVKLIYASVLPMILVRVLQMNIQMVGLFLNNIGITIFGTFVGTQPVSGLMYYLAPINGPQDWMWWIYPTVHTPVEIMLRKGIDIVFVVAGGALFALFWIKTAGLDSKDVARQIQLSGMFVGKVHARIVRAKDGQLKIQHLSGLAGTRVHGEKIAEHQMKHGDEIEIGKQKLLFRLERKLQGLGVRGRGLGCEPDGHPYPQPQAPDLLCNSRPHAPRRSLPST